MDKNEEIRQLNEEINGLLFSTADERDWKRVIEHEGVSGSEIFYRVRAQCWRVRAIARWQTKLAELKKGDNL